MSTSVRDFRGEVASNEDLSDVLHAAVLCAITPATARRDDGSVEWEMERQGIGFSNRMRGPTYRLFA